MSTPTTAGATAPALDPSFDALAKYDRGSGRETLKPIDAAVMAAPKDPELRADLEVRLAAVLRGPASAVAKEYACGKLALVGGPGAVAALAELLSNAGLAHPAADALQRLACVEAATALRESLTKLSGLPLVGVITALGARRDSASVETLNGLLSNADTTVASAAAAALGEIGSGAAAKALGAFVAKAPPALGPALADACLVCAERLEAAGDAAGARTLLEALRAANPPAHVIDAVARVHGGA